MQQKLSNSLFQGLLFFLFLDSLNAWFMWDLGNYKYLAYLFVSCIFYLSYRKDFQYNTSLIAVILYGLAIISMGLVLDVGGVLGFLGRIIPLVLFIGTRNKFKRDTIHLITKYWCVILIPSLLLFALSFLFTLPNLGEIQHEASSRYKYTNYFFFIKGDFYNIRFNSIFLEPGHLGMVVAFLLYVLKFNLKKWEVWVLLIVELFTMSLAGYLLAALAFTFSRIVNRTNLAPLLFIVFFVFGGIYFTAINYNNGNNLVNTLILERLAYDDEKGVAGNNRFSKLTDDLIEDKLSTGDIWFATDKRLWEDEFLGAGWKVFFIKYGGLPVLFFLLYYLSFLLKSRDRRFVFLFIILFVFAFLQRSYPQWYSWNILFIGGIASADFDSFRMKQMIKNFSSN